MKNLKDRIWREIKEDFKIILLFAIIAMILDGIYSIGFGKFMIICILPSLVVKEYFRYRRGEWKIKR